MLLDNQDHQSNRKIAISKGFRQFHLCYDIAIGFDEAGGRGRAAGAFLQGGVRVLRGGRRVAVSCGRGCQVRARAVPATLRAAADARRPGTAAVRAVRGGGAGAVGGGRRAAGVAAALRGGHGGVRGGARGLHRRVRLAAARGGAGAAVLRGGGRLPAAAGAAGRAGAAGAGLRAAAGRHGVARRRAARPPARRRAALPALRRHPRLQPLRWTRALQAGAGDVDVLPGPAGHRAERAGGAARARPIARCERQSSRRHSDYLL